MDEFVKTGDPGEINNLHAVFEVSSSANKALYNRIRRDSSMDEEVLAYIFGERFQETALHG